MNHTVLGTCLKKIYVPHKNYFTSTSDSYNQNLSSVAVSVIVLMLSPSGPSNL